MLSQTDVFATVRMFLLLLLQITMNSVKVNYLAVGVTLGAVMIITMRLYYVNRVAPIETVSESI